MEHNRSLSGNGLRGNDAAWPRAGSVAPRSGYTTGLRGNVVSPDLSGTSGVRADMQVAGKAGKWNKGRLFKWELFPPTLRRI